MSGQEKVDYNDLVFDDYVCCTRSWIPFTGIAFEKTTDYYMEKTYLSGMAHGSHRIWERGNLIKEETYHFNSLYGWSRRWDYSGQLQRESLDALGFTLILHEYDSVGRLTRHYAIMSNAEEIVRFRMAWNSQREEMKAPPHPDIARFLE